MSTKKSFINALIPIMFLILAGALAAAVLSSIHYSQVNKVTSTELVEEVNEDEGPDFMLLPLPGGIPVGGGLYIW